MNPPHTRSSCRKALTLWVGALLFISWSATHLLAQAPVTKEKGVESEEVEVIDPMDTEGLEPKLARVLKNYYERNYTSAENWEELQSIIFEGVLITNDNATPFTAYKKKPDLCKYVLHVPGGRRMILGYDGEVAWQYNPGLSKPIEMPETEARNFIRDAPIGSHLLYPLMPGKKITLSEIVTVDGNQCYEVVVVLPSGQRIRSALDIVTYAERKSTTVNNVNGLEEHTIYSDFTMVDGFRFAQTSVMRTGSKQSHRIELKKIRLNTGLASSMFQSTTVALDDSEEIKPAGPEQFFIKEPEPSTTKGFGEAPFGSTLFPDLETKENPFQQTN